MQTRTSAGFTLIELMVTVAVLVIIVTVAVPSFQNIIENNRLATEVNRIMSSINYTRSEAVRIGDAVSLTANTGGFQNGWCVHTGAACSAATRLRQFEPINVDYDSTANQVTFNDRGERESGVIEIGIEPVGCSDGTKGKRRVVGVSLAGRTSYQEGDC